MGRKNHFHFPNFPLPRSLKYVCRTNARILCKSFKVQMRLKGQNLALLLGVSVYASLTTKNEMRWMIS